MIRILAFMGMAAGFLAFSPALRETAGNLPVQAQSFLTAYSPFSYVAAAAAALGIMFLLARRALARR